MGNIVTKLSKLCASVKERLRRVKSATLAIGPNMKNRCKMKLASIRENGLRRKRNLQEAIVGCKTFAYNEVHAFKTSTVEFVLEQRQNASQIVSTGVKAIVEKVSSVQSSARHKVQNMKSWMSDKALIVRDYSTNQVNSIRNEVTGHIHRVQQSVSGLMMLMYTFILSIVRQSQTYFMERKQRVQAAISSSKDKVVSEVKKFVTAKHTAKQKLQYTLVAIIFISLLTLIAALFSDVYYGDSASAFAKIDATGKIVSSCVEWVWFGLWACVVVTFSLACALFGQLYATVCFLSYNFYCGMYYALCFHIRVAAMVIVWTSGYAFFVVNVTVTGSSIAIKHSLLTVIWAGRYVNDWLNVAYMYGSVVASVVFSNIQDFARFIGYAYMEGTGLAFLVLKHMLRLLLEQVAVVLQITANSTLIALEVTTRLLAVAFNAVVRYALKAAMYTLENGTVALSEGLDMLQEGIVYCVLNAGDLSYLAAIYARDFLVLAADASVQGMYNFGDLLVASSYAAVDLAEKAAAMSWIMLNSLVDIFRWATMLAAKWTVKGLVLGVWWAIWSAFYGAIWLIRSFYATVTWTYSATVYFVTNTREATAAFLQWLLATSIASLHAIGVATLFLFEQFCVACSEAFSFSMYVCDLMLTSIQRGWTGLSTASSFLAEKSYIFIRTVFSVTYDNITRGSTAAVQKLTTGVQVTSSSLQYFISACAYTSAVASKAMYFSTVTTASVSVRCVSYSGALVWSTSSSLTRFLYGIVSGVTYRVSLTLHLVLNKFMLGGTAYVIYQSASIILLLVQVIGKFVVDLFVYIGTFVTSVVSHVYRAVSIFATFFYQIAMTVSLVMRAFAAVVRHILTLVFGVIMFVLNQILGMYLYVMDVYHSYQEIIFLLTVALVFVYCYGLIKDRASKAGSDDEDEENDSSLSLNDNEPPLYQDLASFPAYDDDSGSDAEFQLDTLAPEDPDIDL
jgi:hypothetical protein